MINFIDLIGFDKEFTQRIMKGETDVEETSQISLPWQDALHADLFSLRNLVLSADQAQSHGYRLNDVSLCEERVLANIVSHKFKTDHQFHLLGFVSDFDDDFQESLNTLEFCTKFFQTFNTERSFHTVKTSEDSL